MKKWFEPDNFAGQPYQFLTNQIGHAFMVGGVMLVYAVVMASWFVMGEFPPKWSIIAGAAILYPAYELICQGWQGWDTVEDWWFVVVYGVAGPVTSFTETVPGEAKAVFDLMAALPFIAVLCVHLAIGSFVRSRAK
jgi:hypothetical protein